MFFFKLNFRNSTSQQLKCTHFLFPPFLVNLVFLKKYLLRQAQLNCVKLILSKREVINSEGVKLVKSKVFQIKTVGECGFKQTKKNQTKQEFPGTYYSLLRQSWSHSLTFWWELIFSLEMKFRWEGRHHSDVWVGSRQLAELSMKTEGDH